MAEKTRNRHLYRPEYNKKRRPARTSHPLVAGGGAAVIGGFAGPTGAIAAGVLAGGNCNLWS